jgi:integrase
MKLTERNINKIKAPDPSGKPKIFWDAELRGFGVRASGKTNDRKYVVQRDLPNGKTRRITIGSVAEVSPAEAREAAKDVLHDMRRGIDPKAGRRGQATLRQTLESYLAARKDLRERSGEFYRGIERHLKDWLDLPLSSITADMVEKRHARVGKSTGTAAANGAMRTLRALWNFAAERHADMPANPVRILKRGWFPEPRRTRMVSAEKLPAFYRAVDDLPNKVARDYLLLLLFTGLRRREAAALTWEDVFLKERVIRVPAANTKAGRKLDLPMSTFVRDLLVARRAIGRDKCVFPSNAESGHIEEPKFPLAMVAAKTRVRVSVHDLRRTFITVAESTDMMPWALKALVNHSIGSGVTEGYIQMTTERLREPAQRVCDKLIELCRIPPGNVGIRVVKGLEEAKKA